MIVHFIIVILKMAFLKLIMKKVWMENMLLIIQISQI